MIYSDPNNPGYIFRVEMTFDGNWLIMSTSRGPSRVNKTWIAKVEAGAIPANGTHLRYLTNLGELEWIKIKDDFESGLSYITNNGNVFYFESNLDAPRGKVVRYDVDYPVNLFKSCSANLQEQGFVTIVSEQPQAVLQDASITNERYLLLKYLSNVQNKLFIIPLEPLEYGNGVHMGNGHATDALTIKELAHQATVGEKQCEWIGLYGSQEIEIPSCCSVKRISCRRDESRIFIQCVGYTITGRIYEYKFHSIEKSHSNRIHSKPTDTSKDFGKLTVWRECIVNGFESDRWVTEQVRVPIPNDNVQVPMYIIRNKSHIKSGDSFCLLYG